MLSLYAPSALCQSVASNVLTDARAVAAQNRIETSINYAGDEVLEDATTLHVYTKEEMDYLIEKGKHLEIIAKVDKCQFTQDIEDRARIVGMPSFQFAFGDMLIKGVCVKSDPMLGINYLQKSADSGYAPALERLSLYYEKGYLVGENKRLSEIYMKAAASMGYESARLRWVDMLVRGFGSPKQYEEAYSWLHHTNFFDEYRKAKSEYLKQELAKLMPANVIAKAKAYYHEL